MRKDYRFGWHLMTMISYYDSHKQHLLWQGNATAFQAAQLATHAGSHLGAGTCQGRKERGTQQLKCGERGRDPWGVNHQGQRKHPPT